MLVYIIPVSSKTSALIWALTGIAPPPGADGLYFMYPIASEKPHMFLDDAQLLAYRTWFETEEDCDIRLATF